MVLTTDCDIRASFGARRIGALFLDVTRQPKSHRQSLFFQNVGFFQQYFR
jgi:hypothetical protein